MVVLSLKKLTALTTRCGFSWQISVPPGPHAKIQMWLCVLSVAHSCCVSCLAPEPPGNTYSSIPRKTECVCHQGFWGLRKPPGLLGEKVRIKEKKKTSTSSSYQKNSFISSFNHYHQVTGYKRMYKIYALSPPLPLIPSKYHILLAVFFSLQKLPKSQWRRIE